MSAPEAPAPPNSSIRDTPDNQALESSQVKMTVIALSGLVFLLIAVVIYLLPGRGHSGGPSPLATLNAFLNACAAVCLVFGVLFIKAKSVIWHRRSMLAAFGISSMFLLTYLLHHAQVGSVPFRGTGGLRVLYFGLLIPHIVLSAAVVPMALLTIYRGWTQRITLHKKLAKVTLPLWLYVSISGVCVYYMLYHLHV
jgi:putative membrane protein